MQIRRIDPKTIAVTRVNRFCCDLLRQIGTSADPGDNVAARARLYTSPSGGKDAELDEDWKDYVEPELREQFRSALEVVQTDLEGFPPDETADHHTLRLPMDHLESWINALNQARLALAARHDVTERDMESEPSEGDARALADFQIHFSGYLQECFLRELDGD